MKKYIKNKGYSVKYDLHSLILCYDYFNHGIILPKHLDYTLTRRVFHLTLRFFIILAFIFRLYKFFYKIVELEDEAIIIFKGKGKWSNTVKLIENNNILKVIKIPYDREHFLKEKIFYETYKNNKSKIKLPNCLFQENGIIEIEFLKTRSFQRLINDGSVNKEGALRHFNQIKEGFKNFNNKSISLIHADMSPENIFIKNGNYYLIDFADSHISNPMYDLYILIRSIFFSFNNSNVNNYMKSLSLNYESIARILGINVSDVMEFEKHFKKLDISKHPEHNTNTKVDTFNMYSTSLKNTNALFRP